MSYSHNKFLIQGFEDHTTSLSSTVISASTGDVEGPASATDNAIARYDATTGKLIQNSTATISDAGVLDVQGDITVTGLVDGVDIASHASVTVLNTGASTNNAIAKFDGTSGIVIQDTSVIIDGSNNLSGINDITLSGTVDGVDIAAIGASSNPRITGTGVLTGGILSINADTTKFDISDGTGIVSDIDTGVVTPVSWTGRTAQSTTYSGILTFISIDSSGTVLYSTSKPTIAGTRDNIFLGVLVHTDSVNINAVNNEQMVLLSTQNQIRDLAEAIGFLNTSGNLVSNSGSALTISKSAGTLFKFGSNYDNNNKDPHDRILAAIDTATSGTFQYRCQDGSSSALTLTDIIPNLLDDGTPYDTGTTYGNSKYGVQRVYSFTSNALKIMPSQDEYKSLSEAISAINDGTFVVEPSIAANGVLIGYIVVRGGTGDLSVASDAKFLEAGKFQNSVSNVTGGTQDLQSTYDNSVTPEILTATAQGAFTCRRGTAAETDDVLTVENNAGTVTFSVDGNGAVDSATTITAGTGLTVTTGVSSLNDITCTDITCNLVNEMVLESAGTGNTFLGVSAGGTGFGSITGTQNTIIGETAANLITSGVRNTMIGVAAGQQLTTGTDCVFLGYNSGGSSNATNARTVCIGGTSNAGSAGTGVTDSITIGHESGTLISRQAVIGSLTAGESLQSLIPGTDDECSLGTSANGFTDIHFTGTIIPAGTNVVFGAGGSGTLASGSNNIILGNDALGEISTTASSCVVLGKNALNTLTSGNGHVAIGEGALTTLASGDDSVGIGRFALEKATGTANIAIGKDSLKAVVGGSYNTAYGNNTGIALTTGSNNVFFGDGSFCAAGAVGYSRMTALGSGAECDTANQCTIGNGSIAEMRPGSDNLSKLGTSAKRWNEIFCTNTTINTSQNSLKDIDEKFDFGLDFVNLLKPIAFKWKQTNYLDDAGDVKTKTGTRTHLGFGADDVRDLITSGKVKDLSLYIDPSKTRVNGKAGSGNRGLRTGEFLPCAIKAIQELSVMVEALKARVATLEA